MKTEAHLYILYIDIIKVIMTTATDCAFAHRAARLAYSLNYYLIVLISWNYTQSALWFWFPV